MKVDTEQYIEWSDTLYLKWSDYDVKNNFPILSTDVKLKDRTEIIQIGHKSKHEFTNMKEYFEFAQKQGLTYLVLDNYNLGNDYLKEIFQNEDKYTFLNKIYDSKESGYEHHIKVFEINYELLIYE